MNNYPDGKLGANDQGSLNMAIYEREGRIIIDFGKDVSWLGFDKSSLRTLIDNLESRYKKL